MAFNLEIEIEDNPRSEFWIGEPANHAGSDLRADLQERIARYHWKMVAVFQKASDPQDSGNESFRRQIAQLCYPDAVFLKEQFGKGKGIDLSWCYVDDVSWLESNSMSSDEYREIPRFCADHSVWNICNLQRKVKTLCLLHCKILSGDLSFQDTWFVGMDLVMDDVQVFDGNLLLMGSRFLKSSIRLTGIECAGSRHHRPKISFAGCEGDCRTIQITSCENPIRLDFSSARLLNCGIWIEDDDASELEEICLDRAIADSLEVSETLVKHVYIRQAVVNRMRFVHCTFTDSSLIAASSNKTECIGCILSGIMKLNLYGVKDLGMDDTVIAGKLYMDNFMEVLPAICSHIDASKYNIANQLLTLKENFRQLGEYRNEDMCHLYYHRKATKKETKWWKRIINNFFDLICGYGTKPFRLMILTLMTIIFFALIYLIIPDISFKGAVDFIDYLYVSGVTFFTVGYGDVVPINGLTKIFIIIEAFFGVGMMSCLLALFSRKIIR